MLDQPIVTKYAKQSDGLFTIMYNTTGPVISSFEKDCLHGKGNIGGYYCGMELNYDGNPGIIEVRIPTALINEVDPIGEVVVLGYYLSFFPLQIPFQLMSQDDHYTVYRIVVPSFHNVFSNHYNLVEFRSGGYSVSFMTFVWSSLIFVPSLVAFVYYPEALKKFKRNMRRRRTMT